VPSEQRSAAANEHAAASLSGRVIKQVRYFPLADTGTRTPMEWDFGVWHQPTMGLEVVTGTGQVFSARWNEYDEWGFGVDLFAGPVSEHLPEEAQVPVEVSGHRAWAAFLGVRVAAGFLWNDFGSGRAPCPEAVVLSAGGATAWIIAAGWDRREGRTCVQLGLDDLLVVFDGKLVRALGMYGQERGRYEQQAPH
jgi:hypothetical protein